MARLLPSSTFRDGIAPHNVTAEIVRPRLRTLGVSLKEVQQPVLHEQNPAPYRRFSTTPHAAMKGDPKQHIQPLRQGKGARRPESHDGAIATRGRWRPFASDEKLHRQET